MKKLFLLPIIFISYQIYGQEWGRFSGNTQLNYQTFQEDTSINAEERKSYTSGYTNLLYNYNYT